VSTAQDAVIDRLRLNVKAAGLAVSDAMIEEIIDKGFLLTPTLFAALIENQPIDLVPDYLSQWGDTGSPEAMPTGAGDAKQLPDTIAAISPEVQRGSISPVELAEQALARLDERDPVLNMFQLVLADRARTAARRAEAEIRQGNSRGPLHGIPVAIKDLLHLAGTPTTAGSTIRTGEVVQENAAVVEKLAEAGAIIIGKTRMSEFAYAPASINPHYGPTRNPFGLDHDTGGSSSGSGAAVADGVVFAALGSDTGGSIRIPAAHCGLVGLKATFGRISLHGAINLAWSLDHVGPLTRSVADAALVFDALAGHDSRDARTRHAPPVPVTELVNHEPDVRGVRIGVLRNGGSGTPMADEEALSAWRAGLAALERAGAELVEIDLPDFHSMWVLGGALLAQEAISYHLPTLRTRLHEYGEFMRMRIVAACAYQPGDLVRTQQLRGVFRRRANAIFERVALLSTPAMPAAAPPLNTPSPTTLTMPFNLLGWPAITVPVGENPAGLPLGLQLAGKPWDEATVFRAGLALEQAIR
jgi:Asp-tRNA(Asn)/Glu-tRNA(Gln) amidotransferase A subunit family amidase